MMTKTEELLKLTEAALVIDHNENADWYSETDMMSRVHYKKNARFIAAANPATIKQLVELCRLQHEALKALSMKQARWTDNQIAALEAFDAFEKGEG